MQNYYENTYIPKNEFIMDYKEEAESIIVTLADGTKITVSNTEKMRKKIKKKYKLQAKEVLKYNYSSYLRRKHKREQSKWEKRRIIPTAIFLIFECIMLRLVDHNTILAIGFTCAAGVINVIADRIIVTHKNKQLAPIKNKIQELEKLELWEENKETFNQYAKNINKKNSEHQDVPSLEKKYDLIDLDQKTLKELYQILKYARLLQEYSEEARIDWNGELGKQKTIGTMPNNH